MDCFGILSFAGGLALFLYGMSAMEEGLTRLSGGRLEQLLRRLAANRFAAVLLGLAVTAVLQSSSATTVMVVSFVNSDILKLSQAAGVLMGANIGTTVTSWILSLTGIGNGSLLLRLLNPSAFSPVLALAGVFLLMLGKSDRHRNVGTIFMGFAILMTGMTTMSDTVKPLGGVPAFTGLLVRFSTPLPGVLAGAVLTAILQSSSASVGILQALCATGSVSYAAAIPIIMGQNIGTCVTALLSSVGASRNARRAAMIHLYFNVAGVAVFLPFFCACRALFSFSFLNQPADAAGIAVVHSGFNLLATFLLFPFAGLLEKLACLTIPDGRHD